MFHVRLAGVCIRVENRFDAVQKQYSAFLCPQEDAPAFCVSASEAECRAESIVPAYGEAISLCRKISAGLLTQDVLLLHAAAIDMASEGYLFSGRSGIGKTTHIRLWQQAFGDAVRVINGDKPLLRFEADQLMAYGSPWRGKELLGCNAKAPVKALCFLEQASENRLERLSAEDAMERLFHQVLVPQQAAGMEKLLTLMERILMRIPCYILYCRPDEQAARIAWEGLKEAGGC